MLVLNCLDWDLNAVTPVFWRDLILDFIEKHIDQACVDPLLRGFNLRNTENHTEMINKLCPSLGDYLSWPRTEFTQPGTHLFILFVW